MQRTGEAVGETLRRNAEAFAESQRAFLQTAAQQFEAASRKLADTTPGTVENLRALMALPNTAQGGLQDGGDRDRAGDRAEEVVRHVPS